LPDPFGSYFTAPAWEVKMQTHVLFIDGTSAEFDELAEVKLTDHGVEITEVEGNGKVRVLFPWGRIEKITQCGLEVGASYTF
jgi:hypothetical protein